VNNATYTDVTGAAARLFDLRDARRPSELPIEAGTFDDQADRRLVVHAEADHVFVEQYRRLGAALHDGQLRNGIRTVMVASAVGAEGKTLSATNLALTLSRSFRKRVLLVDGDLRKPSVHALLHLENSSGLTDILQRSGGRLAARALTPTLSVVTGGQHDPDPVSLLASDAAARFLAQARDAFEWVVVDTPPVLLFPDAGLLGRTLDTCVMVVRAASTAAPTAASALEALGAPRVLGVVLNRAEPTDIAGGYGYGDYGYRGRWDTRRRGCFGFWRSHKDSRG
jgi:capsular exopolysaccharide synthesis family protein